MNITNFMAMFLATMGPTIKDGVNISNNGTSLPTDALGWVGMILGMILVSCIVIFGDRSVRNKNKKNK